MLTRKMIDRALPLEGAARGARTARVQIRWGSALPVVWFFRPTVLDAFPKKDTLPVMVWGNGGCAIDSKRYSGFLTAPRPQDERLQKPRTTCAPRSTGLGKKMHGQLGAEKQDRTGQGSRNRPVVRWICLHRARHQSAREDDRRVQFRCAEGGAGRSRVADFIRLMRRSNCTGLCCSLMARNPTS